MQAFIETSTPFIINRELAAGDPNQRVDVTDRAVHIQYNGNHNNSQHTHTHTHTQPQPQPQLQPQLRPQLQPQRHATGNRRRREDRTQHMTRAYGVVL